MYNSRISKTGVSTHSAQSDSVSVLFEEDSHLGILDFLYKVTQYHDYKLCTRYTVFLVTNIAVPFLELSIPGVYRLNILIGYSQKCLASLLKILIIVIKNYVHFEAL